MRSFGSSQTELGTRLCDMGVGKIQMTKSRSERHTGLI